MIDWASGFIQVSHPTIAAGFYFETDSDGEILKQTRKLGKFEGSFSDKLTFKSLASPDDFYSSEHVFTSSYLYFSFNPSKFLQGHNILGSDDLLKLVYDSLIRLFEYLDIQPTEKELFDIKVGNYPLTRVDINYPFLLPTRHDVRSFLRAAELTAKTRHGRPAMKKGTLYFGQNSRRWSTKMYCKADEITVNGHKLPEELKNKHLLEEWVDNILRVELTLRTKELKGLNLPHAKDLTKPILKKLFNDYLKRIDMNKQIRLSDDLLFELPSRLRSTYTLWQNGENVAELLPKTTFYRHRKELKESFNIDITFPMRNSTDANYSNVIPLLRVLEAEPVQVPDWAHEHKLIHCR